MEAEIVKRSEVVMQGGELLPPSPVFRGALMVKALSDYRELQVALDRSMPDQLMTIGDKSFRKKGYWRAIAVAFNLTVEPVTEVRDERSVIGVLADGSENYVYSVSYRAVAPNGRSAIGDGTCAASEKQKGRMEATEHNVRSHAHTRAFNRAVSNLVGFGEVSAEEVARDEHATAETAAPATPQRADGSAKVVKVEEKTGTGKTGRSWTRYLISFDDGRSGSTFDAGIAKHAAQVVGTEALVVPTLEQAGQYVNLTALVAAPAKGQPDAPAPAPTQSNGKEVPTNGDRAVSAKQVSRLWAIAREHGWDSEPEAWSALLQRFGYTRVTTKNQETGEVTIHVKQGNYDALIQAIKEGRPKPAAPSAERQPGEEG